MPNTLAYLTITQNLCEYLAWEDPTHDPIDSKFNCTTFTSQMTKSSVYHSVRSRAFNKRRVRGFESLWNT